MEIIVWWGGERFIGVGMKRRVWWVVETDRVGAGDSISCGEQVSAVFPLEGSEVGAGFFVCLWCSLLGDG